LENLNPKKKKKKEVKFTLEFIFAKYSRILCQKIAKFSQKKKTLGVQWFLGKPITKKRCATTLPL